MIDIAMIRSLSKEEKLIFMEAIWEELSTGEEVIESPDWHNDELKKTEVSRSDGRENIVDWSKAKRELRKRFE